MTRKCKHILYDLSKITSDSHKTAVREKCQHFMNCAEKLKFTESAKLEKNFKALYEFVTPILNKYGLQELIGCERETSVCDKGSSGFEKGTSVCQKETSGCEDTTSGCLVN
ncbi:hypothetical protein JTB14_013904 [Gonioctena quinquepunctata]|nr:hypothetical protein JTB14_013904 [Gonioctena quinquepunctata]